MKAAAPQSDKTTRIMVQSGYGCVGCHQGSAYIKPQQSNLKVANHISKQFSVKPECVDKECGL